MLSHISTIPNSKHWPGHDEISCIQGFSKRAIEIRSGGSQSKRDRQLSTRRTSHPAPGFFDIQINGYTGHDYTGPDLSAAAVEKIVRGVALSGTTRHLATIITAPRERIAKNCGAIATAVRKNRLCVSQSREFTSKGPYIASEDGPRGARRPQPRSQAEF